MVVIASVHGPSSAGSFEKWPITGWRMDTWNTFAVIFRFNQVVVIASAHGSPSVGSLEKCPITGWRMDTCNTFTVIFRF